MVKPVATAYSFIRGLNMKELMDELTRDPPNDMKTINQIPESVSFTAYPIGKAEYPDSRIRAIAGSYEVKGFTDVLVGSEDSQRPDREIAEKELATIIDQTAILQEPQDFGYILAFEEGGRYVIQPGFQWGKETVI